MSVLTAMKTLRNDQPHRLGFHPSPRSRLPNVVIVQLSGVGKFDLPVLDGKSACTFSLELVHGRPLVRYHHCPWENPRFTSWFQPEYPGQRPTASTTSLWPRESRAKGLLHALETCETCGVRWSMDERLRLWCVREGGRRPPPHNEGGGLRKCSGKQTST